MAAVRSLASLGALSALVACGGGGSSGNGAAPPPPAVAADAVLSVSLSGGASPGIDHLWVTVTGLAMHADATRVYGDGDPGWVVQALPAPVTVDLADASQHGAGTSLFKQSVGVLGSFSQLRLLVAPSDPALQKTASASALGLQFNDEVQYTDAGGAHVVPLEVPDLQAGLRVLTPFSLSADTTTPLAIEWNANALVRRRDADGGPDRFTLRNELQGYNQQLLTALGDGGLQIGDSIFDSIAGRLATTDFCTGTAQAGCIHDVVASATSVSADGRFHAEVRSVDVDASGNFLLYPLPGVPLVDVVIHGANMRTIIVRNVVVDPTGLLQPVPTLLGSVASPIVPVLDTGGRDVTLAAAQSPAGSRVFFGQTVAGSGGAGADIPYAIVTAATDPASGRLVRPVTLPGGPLQVATFDPAAAASGAAPVFAAAAPVEGLDAWTAWSQGTLATATSAFTTLPAGAARVAVANPPLRAGFVAGTLSVTLSGSATNGADRAELIVSNDGGTVAVADVSSLIASHGGMATLDVPSGASADAPGAAVYGVALRTWTAGSETATTRWVRAGAPVDLSDATSASVSLALP